MSIIVDRIIEDLKEEIEKRKRVIKRNEDHIKAISNECIERIEIINKLEELKSNDQ